MATLYNDGLVGIDSPHLNDDKFGYENPKRYSPASSTSKPAPNKTSIFRLDRPVAAGRSRCASSRAMFLVLAFHPASNRSPSRGISPMTYRAPHSPSLRQGRPRNTQPRGLKDDESGRRHRWRPQFQG